MKHLLLPLAATLACVAVPVAAEVTEKSDIGFAVRHQADVKATPEAVWEALAAPNRWWDKRHSFTGDADNFFLDLQAGGCFCERIRETRDGKIANTGSVEHMRVVYAEPGKVLRMSGALGPLQSEGVNGTLTVGLVKQGMGTRITFSYVVGGFMRYKIDEIAPAVDGVIGLRLAGLATLLGEADAKTPADDKKADAKKADAKKPDAATKPAEDKNAPDTKKPADAKKADAPKP